MYVNEKKPKKITWDKSISTGLDEQDEQHKGFIEVFNNAVDNFKGGKYECSQEVLSALEKYAVNHFAYEEQLMKQSGFPKEECLRHQISHEDFIDKVRSLIDKCKSKNSEAAEEILFMMQNWIVFHIQGTDTKLAAHVKKNAR